MKKFYLLIIALTIITVSYGGSQVRGQTLAKGTMGWGPNDIQVTTKTMIDLMYSYLAKDWKGPAVIRFRGIRNKCSNPINEKLLVNSIVESLIEKKIAIEESRFIKETMKLIEKKQGELTDKNFSIPVGKLRSSNFYLSGRIDDDVRIKDGKKYNFMVVNLWLIRSRTNMRVWQKQQIFYKVGPQKK